jgi:cell division protein FtsQ
MTRKIKIKISKKRNVQKFLQLLFFWIKFLLFIAVISIFVFEPLKSKAKEQIYFYTNKIGLTLDTIVINGVINSNINSQYILGITGKKKIPILSLDIEKIQNIINDNSWVKGSYIYISLPSTLKIIIEEKKPLALWQNHGRIYIIDQQGDVITNIISSQYRFLPLVVGEGANINAQNLLIELNKSNNLMDLISSCIYVGSRRWDLVINHDLIVQMPEENFATAYNYLISLHKKGELNNLKKLDLRDSKKYYRKRVRDKI